MPLRHARVIEVLHVLIETPEKQEFCLCKVKCSSPCNYATLVCLRLSMSRLKRLPCKIVSLELRGLNLTRCSAAAALATRPLDVHGIRLDWQSLHRLWKVEAALRPEQSAVEPSQDDRRIRSHFHHPL